MKYLLAIIPIFIMLTFKQIKMCNHISYEDYLEQDFFKDNEKQYIALMDEINWKIKNSNY